MKESIGIATTTAVVLIVIVAIVVGAGVYVATRPAAPIEPAAVKVGFPISTVIEEPWIGAIYEALVRAENELGITLDWSDDIGYADLPAVIREWATEYDIIITDSFGCEAAARLAAKDFPGTQFVFGSGLGPVEPNVAVFDDWIHEPAYICGMIAGKLTETNILGVVGGVPVPEVNRLINAFKAGALETNPDVKLKIVFLGEWFNPPKAKEQALAQIEAGADVMYAERYGVHEAALEKLETEDQVIPLFGNLLDQYEMAPELVVTGPVWDMWPTVSQVIDTYIMRDGEPFSMDLAEWTMARKGGAKLAPWHNWETRLDSRIVAKMQAEDIIDMVETRWAEILDGTFRVEIDESVPVSD